MSRVTAKVEHLIRAALKGIESTPGSWIQSFWVCTPEQASRLRGKGYHDPLPECGTSYCLGGWMLLYDGWRHYENADALYQTAWFKGDVTIIDPYSEYLGSLVYGDQNRYHDRFDDSIFASRLTMVDILARIDDQLEINFEEDCPCLTEADSCNLQGCPCGVHTTALELKESIMGRTSDSMTKVIEKFVEECEQAGDRITVRKVLDDAILMRAFSAIFQAGENSMVHQVTVKAERRISEVRTRLEGEVREITQSRDRAVIRNSELRQNQSPTLGAQIDRQVTTIRKLQSQIDALRVGTLETTEFRKLKAKTERLEEENAAMKLNNADLSARYGDARSQLTQRSSEVLRAQQLGRREGLAEAVGAWQKALDIVKKERNL